MEPVTRDFPRQYREQLGFLEASARAYDAGDEAEAKRLALAIRILVHDTRHSTSLLTHLGIRERLPYRDTASADPPPGVIVAMDAGLCVIRMTTGTPGTIVFHPPLDRDDELRTHPPTCFADWWTRPVLRDALGHEFSRSDLVRSVADQDGGAHIDATLNPAYAALSGGESLAYGQASTDDPNTVSLSVTMEGLSPAPNPDAAAISNSLALASIRQIAYELVASLASAVVDDGEAIALRKEICPIPLDEPPDVGRNDACPCGSGRKFKQCFLQRQPRRQATLPGR